jgi:sugar O-acyltransferase (sialic acid O-acetyltransferase NeuD family)
VLGHFLMSGRRNKVKQNIVIIGSSGHAKVVIDIVEKEGRYKIAGFLDIFEKVGKNCFGYKVLGEERDLPDLINERQLSGCIIAIGDNWGRNLLKNKIQEVAPSLEFITTIHPSAMIARGVTLGCGVVVMAGAVINSECTIGDFCVINANSLIDHDGGMGNFSSIAPGVVAGGNVKIGEFSAISIGATIIHSIEIGEHSVVGAGSIVLENVSNYVVAYGAPAKKVRERNVGDKYL